MPMGWLFAELKQSAAKSHVLHLEKVWQHYCSLCEETSAKVPASFVSGHSSFKEKKIRGLLSNVYEFHVICKSIDQEKGTVLVPKEFSHIP